MCQYYCGEVWALRRVPEALDKSELVGDLAALVDDVLLCVVELLLGSGVLEGDLGIVSTVQTTVYLGGLTMKAGMLRLGSEVCWFRLRGSLVRLGSCSVVVLMQQGQSVPVTYIPQLSLSVGPCQQAV